MCVTLDSKQQIILLCLVGIVGSSVVLANAIFPTNVAAIVAAAIGSGTFVLFIAITAELMVLNLQHAISDKKQQENDELLAVVLSKAVYHAIEDERKKKGESEK